MDDPITDPLCRNVTKQRERILVKDTRSEESDDTGETGLSRERKRQVKEAQWTQEKEASSLRRKRITR